MKQPEAPTSMQSIHASILLHAVSLHLLQHFWQHRFRVHGRIHSFQLGQAHQISAHQNPQVLALLFSALLVFGPALGLIKDTRGRHDKE